MEIFALIGASGTGKSHRAQVVAHEYGIEYIIDDGLLIKGSKVLAGYSAKREATKISAIKRALFTDPEHVAAVKAALAEHQPERLLVLGTSLGMVEKIAALLGLPAPASIINIEDISTRLEINRAKRIRAQRGTHVIPAPTFEVKKSFSGYLLNPLRVFLNKRGEYEENLIVEKSVVRPTFSSLGRFFIADNVLVAIAARACSEVPGISRVGRINLETRPEGLIVSIDTTVKYGVLIPEVLRNVQAVVKEILEYMTALNVLAVNAVARRVSVE
ncbi:MAG: Asp23/Gls24 family envelope stress response protein [bacterium]|jgi:uncharacterized alkaline shock family protein YloU